ncbi:Arylsulfatase [Roseimaritima multifibrata]|uniref:Arylsulfatase n=1 Tax=Roseimaritima multifibrata TaxID=1930274 RepID=A0A517MG29_9BACT|nr:sulfatase-like hydrolase/transferase [Roseimaritima multifibrata]QDS93843.1 Arylsulfatase [Roseimaritima multifibrata]
MSVRLSFAVASVGFLLAAGLFRSMPSDAAEKDLASPNLVVFLVDDMGVMDTSVPFLTDESGKPKRYPLNDYYRTPNMVRLAEQGIRFNNFCAMSVCSPTRISIMTGQNAARHRATNWINPDKNNGGPLGPPEWQWEGLEKKDVTLPGVLADSGYETIHIGKAHFAPRAMDGADPLHLGFDRNVAGASFGAPGSYYGMKNYGNGQKRRSHHAVPHLEAYHGTETFLTEALTIEAKKQLDQAIETKKPFFLHMAHYAVHAPFDSDPRFAPNYSESGKPANAQAFATLIEGMDRSLGDLLDYLEQEGVAENTLILFLGDNGSDAPLGHQHAVACAAPLRGKKGSHYEGGMRVPFIAAWAKPNAANSLQQRFPIAVGKIQPQIASVEDIFPTLTSLAGAAVPDEHVVDGYSLAKLVSGVHDTERPESFLMHYPHAPHRSDYFTSYRDGDWKVVYHYVPSEVSNDSHYQLFNLVEDPFESTDLSETEPVELQRMMARLIEELESHEALYPLQNQDSKPTEVRRPKMP